MRQQYTDNTITEPHAGSDSSSGTRTSTRTSASTSAGSRASARTGTSTSANSAVRIDNEAVVSDSRIGRERAVAS